MIQELRLPELGENIEYGTVTRVLVSVGDTVAAQQAVLELETEKAVLEVPSTGAGTVTEIRVAAGDKVSVGQVILLLAADEQEAAAQPAAPAATQPTAPAATQPTAPAATEPTAVSQPEPPKAVEHPREPQRPVSRPAAMWEPAPEPGREAPLPGKAAPVLAAPSVRRLARELGVDLEEVPISGTGRRVSAGDVRAYAESRQAAGQPARPEPPPQATREQPAPERREEGRPEQDRWGDVERRPMTAIRRKTALHISHAWASIPHVTHYDEADATLMEAFRKKYEKQAEAAGGKLTVTVVLAKLLALALRRFPQFNASIDMENEEILVKRYIHIGIAVDTPHGLLVPVVRDVDRKGLIELAAEIGGLAELARERKLTLEQMQGGTFTITNLGGFGGVNFSPIINAPEAAILGVSRARMAPVFVNGAFEPRLMLPLALSYDHRLIDGADAARFTRFIVNAIEQPYSLLLEGNDAVL